jgi:hypothetical protein
MDYQERVFNHQVAAIFQAAINEGKAGELFRTLTNDGSATVDKKGKLVLISATQLWAMLGIVED